MAHIGEIDLSVFSGSQRNEFALVNFNLDFALLKWAAPKEYQDVGNHLAPNRKEEAEDGILHTVARKLKVLFFTLERDIPDTPFLIEAYGKRASTISTNPTLNPKGTSRQHGLFKEYIGADATSIWAAATSGQGAIHVHLLACMIAYMFKGPEGTSIWVELVERRQAILKARVDQSNEFNIAELSASKLRIDRRDLAAWDASTRYTSIKSSRSILILIADRAWLEVADAAFATQQCQLRVIAQAFTGAIKSSHDLYESVTAAWLKAMDVLNKLIQGTPQDVHNAEVLLGLLAWHLYPDMHVVAATTKPILQNDPLVCRGGIMTLGLQASAAKDQSDTGVRWSLPLSHLRYYGKPVVSEGYIMENSGRVRFSELLWFTVGNLTRDWAIETSDFTELAEFFIVLGKYFVVQRVYTYDSRPKDFVKLQKVFGILRMACESFLKTSDRAREDAIRLIRLGQRKDAPFLSTSKAIPTAFGLSTYEKHYELLRKDTSFRISWLRDNLTETLSASLNLTDAFLACRYEVIEKRSSHSEDSDYDNDVFQTSVWHSRSRSPHLVSLSSLWSEPEQARFRDQALSHDDEKELIQLIDDRENHQKRQDDNQSQSDQSMSEIAQHFKDFMNSSHWEEPKALSNKRTMQTKAAKRVLITSKSTKNTCAIESYNATRKKKKMKKSTFYDCILDSLLPGRMSSFKPIALREPKAHEESASAVVMERESISRSWGGTNFWGGTSSFDTVASSEPKCEESEITVASGREPDSRSWKLNCMNLLGDIWSERSQGYGVSVLIPFEGTDEADDPPFEYASTSPRSYLGPLPVAQVTKALKDGHFDEEGLLQHFQRHYSNEENSAYKSLYALFEAAEIYKDLNDAYIDLNIINKPLHEALWIEAKPSAAKSFACIAMFDYGGANIKPEDLKEVIAISARNTLYISEKILQDPCAFQNSNTIHRVVGNMGKPGLLFLTPLKELSIKDSDLSKWNQINHDEFDGNAENCFKETSLHLRLTGYEFPFNVREHGLRDKEALVIQVVVQVYDRGEWIADIDPSNMEVNFQHKNNGLVVDGGVYTDVCTQLPQTCAHTSLERDNYSILSPLTSVDSWLELLDPPKGNFVVRAQGSWTARQATFGVLQRKRTKVILAGDKICWACVKEAPFKGEKIVVVW